MGEHETLNLKILVRFQSPDLMQGRLIGRTLHSERNNIGSTPVPAI